MSLPHASFGYWSTRDLDVKDIEVLVNQTQGVTIEVEPLLEVEVLVDQE